MKFGIAIIPLLLIVLLAGFFVAVPMGLWGDSNNGAASSQPSLAESAPSREQYVAAKVRAWRQFIKAKKRCDRFDDIERDRCLQQARQERAAAISVVSAAYSEARAD